METPDLANHLVEQANSDGTYESVDATGVNADPTTFKMIDRTGIRHWAAGAGPQVATGRIIAEDPNGNYITSGTGAGLVDTVGRVFPSPVSNGSNIQGCPTISGGPSPSSSATLKVPAYRGTAGIDNGTTVNYLLCSTTITIDIPADGIVTLDDFTLTKTVLQSVVLPNGQYWAFLYNDTDGTGFYGSLTDIILPTGGRITYTYATAGTAAGGGRFGQRARIVTSRTVVDNSGSHTWTYTHDATTTKVTDPDQNYVVHTFTPLDGVGSFFETQTDYYSSTGQHLKNVATSYYGQSVTFCRYPGVCMVNVAPQTITTTLGDTNQVSKVTKGYDAGFTYAGYNMFYGMVSSEVVYDYGNGAPSSTVLRGTGTSSYLYQNSSAVRLANLIERPIETHVNDGNGNEVSGTTYSYDDYSLQSSGISTQKEASLGLGNQTKATKWVSSSSSLTTINKYYDTGELYTSTDPGGHVTQYSYDGTGAFASQITYPTTSTPGGTQIQQVDHFVNDGNTGLLVSHTDQNSGVTRYSYDSVHRTTEIDFPDQSWERFAYTDTPMASKVTLTREMDGSQVFTAIGTVDGLGRTVKVQTSDPDCSGGSGYISVDTTYDDLGHKHSVSNPYCTTGDSTYGVTTYDYDALGRTTTITYPDQNTETLSYAGSAMLRTEASNGSYGANRVSQADALGRLTSVCEVASTQQQGTGNNSPSACGLKISATGFLTSYTYDPLGSLLSVSQAGLNPRSFAYDGLSRLTCAVNPEITANPAIPATACTNSGPGQTTYTYNSDGLLFSKKSPAPNQTSGSAYVTATYAYDELHRIISKTYSGGTVSTPPAYFGYDENSAWGISPLTNEPVGHMTSAWTGGSSRVESGQTYASFLAYDAAGHTIEDHQYVQDANLWNTHKYGRDYVGNLTSFDNGQQLNGQEVVLTYQYNAAAHLTSVASSLNDTSHPQNLISSIDYGPFGPTAQTWGNSIAEQLDYTVRGQLNSKTDKAQRAGTEATGTVTLTGSEQLQTVQATHGTGYVDVSGTEQRFGNSLLPPLPEQALLPSMASKTESVRTRLNARRGCTMPVR